MQIITKNLKTALDVVKPGISMKESIEQSSHFAFIENKVFSYNDELCIMCPVEGLNLTGTIDSKELYSYIGKIDVDTIVLTLEETQLKIKAGRSNVVLVMNEEIKLPLDDAQLNEKGKWKTLPDDFAQAVDFVSESCATGIDEPITTCVHVSKDGFVEGTDKHRLSHWKFAAPLEIENVLIPATSSKVVVKFNPIKISMGNGWVHFKNKIGATLSCRCFNTKYMDTERILAKPTQKGIKIDFPDKLLSVIERAQVFAERAQKSYETITIAVNKKKLFVLSESELGSTFRESLPTDYTGEDFEFMITPYMIRNILKQLNSCTIYPDRLRFANKSWIHIASLKITNDAV